MPLNPSLNSELMQMCLDLVKKTEVHLCLLVEGQIMKYFFSPQAKGANFLQAAISSFVYLSTHVLHHHACPVPFSPLPSLSTDDDAHNIFQPAIITVGWVLKRFLLMHCSKTCHPHSSETKIVHFLGEPCHLFL